MRCPFCQFLDTRVSDTRVVNDGRSIKRRRECPNCLKRFTTFEKTEEIPLVVVKKDGRREQFSAQKILNGLIKSFEKRTISMDEIVSIATDIEQNIRQQYEREVPSDVIGEIIMQQLIDIDQVAYVRFASVYRQFADINNFMQEIQKLSNNNNNNNNNNKV